MISSSPTVYVRYSTLQAGDFCQTEIEPNVGVGINITTLEFQPTELSTLRKATNMDANTGTYQLDFRDWGTECTTSLPLSTATDSKGIVGQWAPCFAILAIPSRVLDLQPEWTTCINGEGVTGVHDPPYALTPVAGAALTPSATPSRSQVTIPPATSPSPLQGPSPTRIVFAPSTVTVMEPNRPSTTILPPADPPSSKPGGSMPSVDPASSSTTSPSAVTPSNPIIKSTADSTVAPAAPSRGITTTPETLVSLPSPGHTVRSVSGGPTEIVVVGGTVPTPGGSPVTVSGTPISLGASGVIVVDSSTLVQAQTTAAAFAVGSVTVAVQPSDIVVGGTTLTPGAPAVTVNSIPVSLGTDALVIGTQTETILPGSASPADGLGGLIMSGLGAVGGSTVSMNSLTPTIRPFMGQGPKDAQPSLIFPAFAIYMAWILL